MGRPRILDRSLLNKIANKLGKNNIEKVNILVSKKAGKFGISPEAALVLLAKELGLGTSTYQRSLGVNKQAEIRGLLPTIFTKQEKVSIPSFKPKIRSKSSMITQLKAAIEYLIEDSELKGRCQDLILAPSKFDRVINQATLVLEDRIRKKVQPTRKLVGVDLVNYALKGDLTKTILKISDDAGEQEGFTNIFRGVILAFRNPTHHYIINTLTREEALRFCGFVDVLLKVIEKSAK